MVTLLLDFAKLRHHFDLSQTGKCMEISRKQTWHRDQAIADDAGESLPYYMYKHTHAHGFMECTGERAYLWLGHLRHAL
jgi:hypothetical protein